MIGTHNSCSYVELLYKILWPFNFMAKCQTKNLAEQFSEGARSFDLRFAWHRGKWYAAHGAMLYKITLEQALNELIGLSLQETLYFRVLCEDTFYLKSDYKKLYDAVTKYLQGRDHDLNLLYVVSKKNWNNIINMPIVEETMSYDSYWNLGNDRVALCEKVYQMCTIKTSDKKINFICGYDSPHFGLWPLQIIRPKTAAKALTPIAKKVESIMKKNNCIVVDFI